MAASFVGYTTISQPTFFVGYETVTIGVPGGVQDGDTLFFYLANSYFIQNGSFVLGDQGWTGTNFYSNGVSVNMQRAAKVASGEPASYVFTRDPAEDTITTYFGAMVAYRGLDPVDYAGAMPPGNVATGGTGAIAETLQEVGWLGYNATADPSVDAAVTERVHLYNAPNQAYVLVGDIDLITTTVPNRTATVAGSSSLHSATTHSYGLAAAPPAGAGNPIELPTTKLDLKVFPNKVYAAGLDGFDE